MRGDEQVTTGSSSLRVFERVEAEKCESGLSKEEQR